MSDASRFQRGAAQQGEQFAVPDAVAQHVAEGERVHRFLHAVQRHVFERLQDGGRVFVYRQYVAEGERAEPGGVRKVRERPVLHRLQNGGAVGVHFDQVADAQRVQRRGEFAYRLFIVDGQRIVGVHRIIDALLAVGKEEQQLRRASVQRKHVAERDVLQFRLHAVAEVIERHVPHAVQHACGGAVLVLRQRNADIAAQRFQRDRVGIQRRRERGDRIGRGQRRNAVRAGVHRGRFQPLRPALRR